MSTASMPAASISAHIASVRALAEEPTSRLWTSIDPWRTSSSTSTCMYEA